jgi:hypothetical protein
VERYGSSKGSWLSETAAAMKALNEEHRRARVVGARKSSSWHTPTPPSAASAHGHAHQSSTTGTNAAGAQAGAQMAGAGAGPQPCQQSELIETLAGDSQVMLAIVVCCANLNRSTNVSHPCQDQGAAIQTISVKLVGTGRDFIIPFPLQSADGFCILNAGVVVCGVTLNGVANGFASIPRAQFAFVGGALGNEMVSPQSVMPAPYVTPQTLMAQYSVPANQRVSARGCASGVLIVELAYTQVRRNQHRSPRKALARCAALRVPHSPALPSFTLSAFPLLHRRFHWTTVVVSCTTWASAATRTV